MDVSYSEFYGLQAHIKGRPRILSRGLERGPDYSPSLMSHSQYYGSYGHIKGGHRIRMPCKDFGPLLNSLYGNRVLGAYQKY